MCRGHRFTDPPVVGVDLPCLVVVAARETEPRYRGNAGQGLAAKAERGDRFEVFETDKQAPDLRARGLLRYVDEHHLRFARTNEPFVKGGANSPENFLAYEEFDATSSLGGRFPGFLHAYTAHVNESKDTDPTWQGGKGKGIFAATYQARGPREDPTVFVNPLAALAPGILRELFSGFEAGEASIRTVAPGQVTR